MSKRWLEVLTVLALVVGIPSSVAQIAQYIETSNYLPKWLTVVVNLIPAGLLSPLISLSIFALIVMLLLRIAKTDARAQGDADRRPSSGLKVISDGPSGTTVCLGEREFGLGPGAYEFLRRQTDTDQEKIMRLMRRVQFFNKPTWTKEDFVKEVDEKQRVAITLARYIAEGDKLKTEINLEVIQRRLKELEQEEESIFKSSPYRAIVAQSPAMQDYTLGRMRADQQEWHRKVTEFLTKERPDMAAEFAMAVPHPGGQPSVLDVVLHEMTVLMERLLDIKRRAER